MTKFKKIFLSDNFTLAEMTKSSNALRFGVKNIPDENEVSALRMMCEEILEPVRKYFNNTPYAPKSAFRCPQVNRLCNGSSKSQHITGNAVDIELPGVDNYILAKWIMENLTFDQLILELYHYTDPQSGWVHVSLLQENNRGQVLRTPDGKEYHIGLKPS